MYNNYPRPQMKRNSFIPLNGQWKCNGKDVYVPSCQYEENLVYLKTFEYSKTNDRLLLHFDGSDQLTEVFVNDCFAGKNLGGYLPFCFDITEIVKEGKNTIRVNVTDKLDKNIPYGKQRKDHGGMWYTPTSGLWKSVWLEEVPSAYIKDVKINTDLQKAVFDITVFDGKSDQHISQTLNVENPTLWTPQNPKLYYHTISYEKDSVEVYFALRTVTCTKTQVLLNGKPVFLNGVLDQGYWQDGLLTPSSEEEFEKDILRIKALGFNMLRKHIKIEPEQFYYDCDRLGMLVMQDMVNNGDYKFFRDTVLGTVGLRWSDKNIRRISQTQKEIWTNQTLETVKHLYNHPSIIAWTLFNEGWGQFDADKAYTLVKKLDPSRLIDSTSGWFKQKLSDFDSQHVYFRIKHLKHNGKQPLLLSECGGFSLNLNGQKHQYGYGACNSEDELTDKIINMYKKMVLPGLNRGICGCIYTQVSDVQDEINGLYTFDRSKCKVNAKKLKAFFDSTVWA